MDQVTGIAVVTVELHANAGKDVSNLPEAEPLHTLVRKSH